MDQRTRPPLAAIERIFRSAGVTADLTRQRLWTCMRNEFRGTAYRFPTVIELWESYRALVASGTIHTSPAIERVLRVKDVRTDSGVAPITVLTKPYPCPGKCVYCPTEARMPKSYISSEPAAARALRLKFDPYQQVIERVQTLERNGHEAKKIELIIKGGTWSSYRWDYRAWFVKRCFDAANDLGVRAHAMRPPTDMPVDMPADMPTDMPTDMPADMPTDMPADMPTDMPAGGQPQGLPLRDAQRRNETAVYRIIGLTIETRPDWVNATEIIRLRELGCTRVELGVQTLQDDVLALTQRGHTVEATIRATALLRQAGFKIDYHILPGQPGSSPEKDLTDFRTLFADPRYKPDMIKLYPCVVLPTAELHAWAEEGRFTALEGDVLKELLISMQLLVPRYCRISRLIRDFPENDISYGNKITNLRETLETEMKKRGVQCQCLRCREAGHVSGIDPATVDTQLFEEWIDTVGGREVFLTIEDTDRRAVFAFLRLRLTTPALMDDPLFLRESQAIERAFPSLAHTAFVRELHTYGTALALSQSRTDASQHKGYGQQLMRRAEEIATTEGYANIAVISGIGVREYYRVLGYTEHETYMQKQLEKTG